MRDGRTFAAIGVAAMLLASCGGGNVDGDPGSGPGPDLGDAGGTDVPGEVAPADAETPDLPPSDVPASDLPASDVPAKDEGEPDVPAEVPCEPDVPPPALTGCWIELTWTTPDDTDECDPRGTDLDLHFAHPFATGTRLDPNGEPYGYFDENYDCYWFNASPANWKEDGSDNPRMFIDDTDGLGPEIIAWETPAPERCARVGVHYFNTWTDPATGEGFGGAVPRIRAFKDGVAFHDETLGSPLKFLDLWDVGRACCAEGTFQKFANPDGGAVIVPNYKDESM